MPTYNLDDNVLLAELIYNVGTGKDRKQYTKLPKYPAVTRIYDRQKVLASNIEKTIKARWTTLEKVELFDIYEGDQIPEGHRNLAYSQARHRTDTKGF